MRRRKVLALGAATLSLPGCTDRSSGAAMLTPTGSVEGTPTESVAGNGSTSTRPEPVDPPTRIGASLHGRPHRLGDDLELVERSGLRWLHAFLDVRRKLDADVPPEEDPDVLALRRASREFGAILFVSLQWNFIGIFGEQPATNVPPAGSAREEGLLDYAVELLSAIDEPIAIIALGNEPIWETKDGDFQGTDPPLLTFTRRLKDRLVGRFPDAQLILGAFNRLYSEYVRKQYRGIYRRLLRWARTDDDIDGIDLHVHYKTLAQAERFLAVARRAFPEGTITATEFSPVWRYKQHKDAPIATFDGGERFAERYGLSGDVTVVEYLEAAKDDRLAPREMADFMAAMPWYNVDFVEDMYDVLDAFGAAVGTFCFLTERDIRQLDWTTGWNPFQINCLFQPGLIESPDGAHPFYLEDFRRRA